MIHVAAPQVPTETHWRVFLTRWGLQPITDHSSRYYTQQGQILRRLIARGHFAFPTQFEHLLQHSTWPARRWTVGIRHHEPRCVFQHYTTPICSLSKDNRNRTRRLAARLRGKPTIHLTKNKVRCLGDLFSTPVLFQVVRFAFISSMNQYGWLRDACLIPRGLSQIQLTVCAPVILINLASAFINEREVRRKSHTL
jgi:hypothetical protein